jgi:hypothetical protein
LKSLNPQPLQRGSVFSLILTFSTGENQSKVISDLPYLSVFFRFSTSFVDTPIGVIVACSFEIARGAQKLGVSPSPLADAGTHAVQAEQPWYNILLLISCIAIRNSFKSFAFKLMSGVWNETEPNGGNSLTDSAYINSQYTAGDIAWILFAGALVWLMIPGIG